MSKRRKKVRYEEFPWDGQIEPGPEDFELVDREYPNEPPAKQYQLAQAAALIRWFESTKKG